MLHPTKGEFLLSVYPIASGFAFILFEGPLAPYEWGIRYASRKTKRGDTLEQIKQIIEEYRPITLVIEDAEEKRSRRSLRVRKIYRELTRYAEAEFVEVVAYSKENIKRCFASIGVTTKHNIASAIAREIPVFINQLPPERKCWMPEDRKQALFDAAALAMTHYAATAHS